jgi:mono/diheme cytochrome c family protein
MRIVRFVTMSLILWAPAMAAAQQTTIKHEPAKPTSAASGQEMYVEYCAACHGRSGKGDGPAVPALKIPPANLTTLAAQNGGQFPEARVLQAIKAGPSIPAHGSQEMPIWGHIFTTMSTGKNPEAEVQMRVRNLMEYIKTLQVK